MTDTSTDIDTIRMIEFEQIDAYVKAAGISCHKQGLFSAFNYFKTERGFNIERLAN